MPTFYGAIDLIQNELRNARVQNLGSAPAAPVTGQLWYDSSTNILKWWSGSAWVPAMGGAGAVPSDTVTTQAIGDTPVPGASVLYARGDHKHGMPLFGPAQNETVFGSAPADGVSVFLSRSDHKHGNPTHDAAAHAGIPINSLGGATGPIDMNGFVIGEVGDPVLSTDAANKGYVDNLVAGLSWKEAVRAASTANMAVINGNTLDGVTLVTGDRVLLKNQTTASQNGIYRAITGGSSWVRTTDADAIGELEGAAVFVMEGTTNADTAWVVTTDGPITPGTTAHNWAQFAGGGTVTAGAGMTQAGNVLNVIAGDATLTVSADDVKVNVPTLAGAGLVANGTALDIVGGVGITVVADAIAINTALVARRYAANLTGTASPEVVTHNLNTQDVMVQVHNGASPFTAVEVDWDATNNASVTLRYNPNLGAGYRVVVMA